MRKARLHTVHGSLLAILALAASSVAACACTHHGTKAVKPKASCHATAVHETPPTVEISTDNNRVEKDCNCNILISPASALGRSDSKRSVLQQAGASCIATPEPELAAVQETQKPIESAKPGFNETLARRRAPSRAPPRL